MLARADAKELPPSLRPLTPCSPAAHARRNPTPLCLPRLTASGPCGPEEATACGDRQALQCGRPQLSHDPTERQSPGPGGKGSEPAVPVAAMVRPGLPDWPDASVRTARHPGCQATSGAADAAGRLPPGAQLAAWPSCCPDLGRPFFSSSWVSSVSSCKSY